MEKETLQTQQPDTSSVAPKKKTLPKIVPPVSNEKPDTGYKYILTDITQERYQPKVEEEIEEAKGKLTIIKNKVVKDIDFFKNERRKNKFRAFYIRIMSTFLAAIITILLGLHLEGFEKIFSGIALVISGFLTVIGILQKMLDSKDLWVQYTDTVAQLEGLLFSIDYLQVSERAIRLKDVDYVKLKYDKIMYKTTDFIIKVRSDTGEE